jgi:hypothetical protein
MYKIHWRKSVSRSLLDRCARADQLLRDAILGAMENVEEILRDEPEFAGESRDTGKRFLIVKPLSITYKVDHRSRTVIVVDVRVHRKDRI